MKAITILRELIKAGVNTENCGIIRIFEQMSYTEFIRQYFHHEFPEYPNIAVSEGEYFYCWHNDVLFFDASYVHNIEGHYLYIIPLND